MQRRNFCFTIYKFDEQKQQPQQEPGLDGPGGGHDDVGSPIRPAEQRLGGGHGGVDLGGGGGADIQGLDESMEYGELVDSADLVRYAIWQLERCPESGRLHLQGYIELHDKMRVGRLKRLLGSSSLHAEARRGKRDQAREYCRKEESRVAGPWEFGTFDRRSSRPNGLSEVTDRIQGGASIRTVMEEFPCWYVRYRSGLSHLAAEQARKAIPSWRNVQVHVYWGATGTGKTRKACDDAGDDGFILDQGERVWFDGYSGESTLIIDDFYGWIKYGMLLRILDGHKYRAEVKGSHVWAAWTTVVITSNKAPEEWYSEGMRDALARRLATGNTVHFNNFFQQ